MANIIVDITKDSAAWRAGMRKGETLVAINGERVVDIIDYQYFSSMRRLVLETTDASGKKHRYRMRKAVDENIGLIFENALMDEIRSCANHCIFCFIAQMPPRMRDTLYVKDDDWRMSLMMGNYITLTNVGEREFQRMLDRQVSPLYISVHATDPEIRCRMMNNPNAGNLMERLQRLAKNKIHFNCQIVLCPGFNDGEVLKKTLADLFALSPYAVSTAVVPVGMTKFREHLTKLTPVDRAHANAVIDIVEAFAAQAFEKTGTRFVFASDEMYMVAERPLPHYAYYEDFPQIENGVGLCVQLVDTYEYAKERYGSCSIPRRVTMATGQSAAPFLRQMIGEEDLVQIVPIKNKFFGESIIVAGLVTGGDLIDQLQGMDLGEELLIPSCMLRSEGDLFLDDVPIEAVEQQLHIKTTVVAVDGESLYCALYGIKQKEDEDR